MHPTPYGVVGPKLSPGKMSSSTTSADAVHGNQREADAGGCDGREASEPIEFHATSSITQLIALQKMPRCCTAEREFVTHNASRIGHFSNDQFTRPVASTLMIREAETRSMVIVGAAVLPRPYARQPWPTRITPSSLHSR